MNRQVAVRQLMEMGIPAGRAKAALERTKGDAMSAAERVFAGDFDDISSDDDEVDFLSQGQSHRATGLRTPEEQPMVERVQRSITIEDEDSETGDSEEGMYEYEGYDDTETAGGERIQSDPYAGIFFSKDRTEHVFEPVVEHEYIEMSGAGEDITVRLLDRSEWMSGCPEGNEQSFLFQLYSTLGEDIACAHGCGQTLRRRKEDFFCLWPDFPSYLEHLSMIVRPKCGSCGQCTCLACGEKVDGKDIRNVAANTKGKGRSLEDDRLLHCMNLQGVLVGVGLHMIEEAFAAGKSLSLSSPRPKDPPSKKRKTASASKKKKTSTLSINLPGLLKTPHGVTPEPDESEDDDYDPYNSYRSSQAKGVGYAGAVNEDRSWHLAAQQVQEEADKRTVALLAQVKVYLPSLDRVSGTRTSDHMIHPTTLAHLRRRSAFVNDLLRNDSLLDMSSRGELYRTLFDWLEAIANHEALASMLAMPQMRQASSEPSEEPHTMRITYEGASSPRELLESCVIQAQAALKGLQATSYATQADTLTEEEKRLNAKEAANRALKRVEVERSDENSILKAFCERIIAAAAAIDRSIKEVKGEPFVARMLDNLPKLPETGEAIQQESIEGSSEIAAIAIYERWAGRARFQYCDMSQPSSSSNNEVSFRHAFNSQLRSLEMQDAPKRSLAIAKELAILTTALPVAWHSTIFLRVDEHRVDCIKAMIIGPEGTPYENGCFIFDIFLPLDYNARCPSVKSMTTYGGKYRYNPNLYADGKVCLSLLGTWNGPGWIAGQSTLLQVLISIQSLILCEEPYCNEPGWASGGGSTASKSYSANVRRMTVADAMANNIKSPPYPFEHEIKTHFRLKSSWIRQQLYKWKALDDGHPISADAYTSGSRKETGKPTPDLESNKSPFDKHADELRRLLDALDTK